MKEEKAHATCLSCASSCHKGHDLSFLSLETLLPCTCSGSADSSHCSSQQPLEKASGRSGGEEEEEEEEEHNLLLPLYPTQPWRRLTTSLPALVTALRALSHPPTHPPRIEDLAGRLARLIHTLTGNAQPTHPPTHPPKSCRGGHYSTTHPPTHAPKIWTAAAVGGGEDQPPTHPPTHPNTEKKKKKKKEEEGGIEDHSPTHPPTNTEEKKKEEEGGQAIAASLGKIWTAAIEGGGGLTHPPTSLSYPRDGSSLPLHRALPPPPPKGRRKQPKPTNHPPTLFSPLPGRLPPTLLNPKIPSDSSTARQLRTQLTAGTALRSALSSSSSSSARLLYLEGKEVILASALNLLVHPPTHPPTPTTKTNPLLLLSRTALSYYPLGVLFHPTDSHQAVVWGTYGCHVLR